MDIALMLLGVTAFPVACLGILLWLTHLEETLPRDVGSALRASTPPPVLAVPIRRTQLTSVASTAPEGSRQARPAEEVARPATALARPAEALALPAEAAG